MCGRISSGKTTYAMKLKNETPAVFLSADDLMLTLFDACLANGTTICCTHFTLLLQPF
jgi:predicted kinase